MTEEFVQRMIENADKGIMMTDDDEDILFNEFVPSRGNAPTVGGELIRCANRIGYRYLNDGDVYNKGYGKETVNPAMVILGKCMRKVKPTTEEGRKYFQRVRDDITSIKENSWLFSYDRYEGAYWFSDKRWEAAYRDAIEMLVSDVCYLTIFEKLYEDSL